MYIYERKKWPHFTWDKEKISELLIALKIKQSHLLGGMESIGFRSKGDTLLETLTQDVIKSSEIEGEILDQTQVRSSVARHLGMDSAGLDVVDRRIDGVVEMMLDATQNYHLPLTQKRLFLWHKKLFPTGQSGFKKITIGAWRKGPVEVVSGKMGKEIIHFEGPKADLVPSEMKQFFYFCNHEMTLDSLIKAAISHLWFVTIHPFDDGNGRIGRAIGDLMLARSEHSPQRFYSLSSQIQKERKDYYRILELSQKGELNITPWIEWFLSCLGRAMDHAQKTLNSRLHKAHFWETLVDIPLNDRQRKMINSLLDGLEGKLTTSKWAKMTKCSQDTAHRDILDLIDRGIFVKSREGGRSTSYVLKIF